MSEQVSWLSEEQQVAWRAYLRASRALEVVLDQDLRDHGIGLSEYEIISMLSESPSGRQRMSELADTVIQSRSRLTHTASRLERRGWVSRVPAADDGRGVELVLTDAGRDAVQEMAKVHVNSVRTHLVDVLTARQLDVLGQAMTKVLKSARPGYGKV